MTCASVDLPEPFGPMIACTSPGLTLSDRPWRISRSSTRTFKSFTSSNAVILFPCGLQRPNKHRNKEPDEEAQGPAASSQFSELGYLTPSRQAADQSGKRADDRHKQKDRKWHKPDECKDAADHRGYPTLPSS